MARVFAHVAIVEDDMPVRRALVRVLAAAGFRVSSYESAEEFLATSGTSAGCALIDIHLPAMDGLELADCLRESARPVPVVLITADHELAHSAQVRLHGHICVTKPVDERVLLNAISQALRH